MKKILILGCGDVGTELASILSTSGYLVTGVRRNHPPRDLPYHPLSFDVCEAEAYAVLEQDYQAVVYAVAADKRTEEAYRKAYVEGLRQALKFFEQLSSSPRFIFVSSTGVYGQDQGEWVDETSVCNPQQFSGTLLREAERLLESSPLDSIIVRLGGIYGPDRTRLLRMVRNGELECVRNYPRFTNRIHRDDAARLLKYLIELPHPRSLYIGVDDAPTDASEVYAWLAAELGVASPPVVEWTEAQREAHGQGKRCRNNLIKEEGFSFTYPSYREGYQSILSGEKSC